MRKQFLTTVAAMAISTPAFAADLSSGYIPPSGSPVYSSAPISTARNVVGDLEFSLGYQDFEASGGCCSKSFNVWNFSGWGRANVPVGNWNLLFETGGNAYFGGDFPSGKSFSNLSAVGHVWSGAGGFRYGAFGGATFGLFGSTWGSVGAEAEADFGNATVGAQGFYSWASNSNPNVYGLNGWLDYYFTQNTKVTLGGQWAHIDQGGGGDILGASARITHRFAGSPLNVFAEGQYANFSGSGPDTNYYAALAGFTINLDGGMTQEGLDKAVPFTFRGPLPRLGVGF